MELASAFAGMVMLGLFSAAGLGGGIAAHAESASQHPAFVTPGK